MASLKKIEDRTNRFIIEYERLSKRDDFPTHDVLASIIGVKSKGTITEILGKRQNIQPDQWEKFKLHFGIGADISGLRDSNAEKGQSVKGTPDKYLALLEENDRFFKTQYHSILTSLSKLIEIGKRSEELIKLNLEHTGTVEALQKGVDPDVVHEQINNQIAELGASEETGNDGHN